VIEIMITELNIWAIVVCMLVAFLTGSLWFNPKTFFMIWWKAIGKTDKDIPGQGSVSMGTVWSMTALSSFVQPLFLAIVIGLLFQDGATAWLGMQVGILMWLGFIAPTYLVNRMFAGHGWVVWSIETSNHLVNMILFGLILGAWH
jgi:hypothetical protein